MLSWARLVLALAGLLLRFSYPRQVRTAGTQVGKGERTGEERQTNAGPVGEGQKKKIDLSYFASPGPRTWSARSDPSERWWVARDVRGGGGKERRVERGGGARNWVCRRGRLDFFLPLLTFSSSSPFSFPALSCGFLLSVSTAIDPDSGPGSSVCLFFTKHMTPLIETVTIPLVCGNSHPCKYSQNLESTEQLRSVVARMSCSLVVPPLPMAPSAPKWTVQGAWGLVRPLGIRREKKWPGLPPLPLYQKVLMYLYSVRRNYVVRTP